MRLLTSSKYQAAIVVTVLGAIPVFYQLSDPGIPRPDKTQLLTTYIASATVAWLAAVAGTSAEDYATNRDTPSGVGRGGPTVQVNTTPEQPSVNVNTASQPPPPRPPSPDA